MVEFWLFDKGEKLWCWFVMKGILKMIVWEMRVTVAIYAFCARLFGTWVLASIWYHAMHISQRSSSLCQCCFGSIDTSMWNLSLNCNQYWCVDLLLAEQLILRYVNSSCANVGLFSTVICSFIVGTFLASSHDGRLHTAFLRFRHGFALRPFDG